MNTLDPQPLAEALLALRQYGPGSSRAALLPIDDAARDALDDTERRQALEGRLLEGLATASPHGQAYLMSKLALVGSTASVVPLTNRLMTEDLADAACRALEALPCSEAVKALRERLPELSGTALLGAITVLGRRRDPDSVPLLAQRASDAHTAVAGASLAALGRIASTAAGEALRAALASAPVELRAATVAAARDCADRLAHAGHRRAAEALLKAVHPTAQRR